MAVLEHEIGQLKPMRKGDLGKLLVADLSTGTTTDDTLPENLLRDFIGGYGVGARLLLERMHPGKDPLGPNRAISSIPLAHLASFLIIAAALVWLTACSGATASGSAGSLSSTSAPNASSQGGTGTTGGQPQEANPGTGEEPRNGSSPAAAGNGQIRPKPLTAQDQGQGGITIKATWVVSGSPEAASVKLDRELGFVVGMDTHSVDLGQYNLAKLSILRDDKGKEFQALAWESTSEGSHHRGGILTFARGIEPGSKWLQLVIRDVGGAKERVLKWDLP